MLLGIDIGTSAVKAVVVDESGAVRAGGAASYGVDQPREGWSEQAPSAWWRGVVEAVRAATASLGGGAAIRAVGLSGQMHGAVLLDGAAIAGARERAVEALRPALLWNDQRTAAQCGEIERALGGRAGVVVAVGNAPLTGFTLPKLLWVREHEPEIWARVRLFCMPKDFVRMQMTGLPATDVGDGAGTLLLDVRVRKWNLEAAARVGIDAAQLPPLLEAGAPAGEITPWAAAELGLRAGTLVVAGSGDNQAGAIGAGVVGPGMVLATLGTSGVIYAHSATARFDEAGGGRVHTMCAANGDAARAGAWSITGCMLSAAGSLEWARRVLAPGASYEELLAEAEKAPPGCEGLVFLPHLTGERCPYADPRARGGWIGVTARHGRGHLVRAVLEGVTFCMGQILGIVRSLPVEVGRVRLGGGGNKSGLWRRMQADVYGVPVATLAGEEGPAFGAALLAGVGAGVWRSVGEACAATVREVETIEPRNSRAYERARELYAGMYPRLKGSWG